MSTMDTTTSSTHTSRGISVYDNIDDLSETLMEKNRHWKSRNKKKKAKGRRVRTVHEEEIQPSDNGGQYILEDILIQLKECQSLLDRDLENGSSDSDYDNKRESVIEVKPKT